MSVVPLMGRKEGNRNRGTRWTPAERKEKMAAAKVYSQNYLKSMLDSRGVTHPKDLPESDKQQAVQHLLEFHKANGLIRRGGWMPKASTFGNMLAGAALAYGAKKVYDNPLGVLKKLTYDPLASSAKGLWKSGKSATQYVMKNAKSGYVNAKQSVRNAIANRKAAKLAKAETEIQGKLPVDKISEKEASKRLEIDKRNFFEGVSAHEPNPKIWKNPRDGSLWHAPTAKDQLTGHYVPLDGPKATREEILTKNLINKNVTTSKAKITKQIAKKGKKVKAAKAPASSGIGNAIKLGTVAATAGTNLANALIPDKKQDLQMDAVPYKADDGEEYYDANGRSCTRSKCYRCLPNCKHGPRNENGLCPKARPVKNLFDKKGLKKYERKDPEENMTLAQIQKRERAKRGGAISILPGQVRKQVGGTISYLPGVVDRRAQIMEDRARGSNKLLIATGYNHHRNFLGDRNSQYKSLRRRF